MELSTRRSCRTKPREPKGSSDLWSPGAPLAAPWHKPHSPQPCCKHFGNWVTTFPTQHKIHLPAVLCDLVTESKESKRSEKVDVVFSCLIKTCCCRGREEIAKKQTSRGRNRVRVRIILTESSVFIKFCAFWLVKRGTISLLGKAKHCHKLQWCHKPWQWSAFFNATLIRRNLSEEDLPKWVMQKGKVELNQNKQKRKAYFLNTLHYTLCKVQNVWCTECLIFTEVHVENSAAESALWFHM